ncbi:FEZ-like protein domain-containing protein [Ditylenchus destructor]|uniref:FEZ-like protein domain-containing protein n=1 Tax=Ditylenchus destructor TaxID=166010 RepID=A0AAD4RAA6_9BILA|nr:FEZ-like protein domain-containing protein [Ditylenchus destructor]
MVAGAAQMEACDIAADVPDIPLAQIDDDADSSLSSSLISKNDPAENKCENNRSQHDDSSNCGSHLSGSLENLVENFDTSINTVLKNLDESTVQMAPVQIRSQDEVMSESQVWWTLTGNYGNAQLMPLDFNKMLIRKNQLDALNLQSPKDSSYSNGTDDAGYDPHEEEELRQSMDLHQLISEHIHIEGESPPLSADQVIEEIDEMMQACDFLRSSSTDKTIESVDSMYSSMKSPFTSSSQAETEFKLKHNAAMSVTKEELKSLPQSKLLALTSEMDQIIQAYNMDLVNELALRDELEYEKEVKNKFITLLVNIQDQRRKGQTEKKRLSKSFAKFTETSSPVTNVSIPFDETQNNLHISTLESLIKILEAIKEDNPQLPNLLTEYILTVVCPSTTTSMIL